MAECRKCGKRIMFLKTSRGTSMPVDYDEEHKDDKLFNRTIHTSHFATCPKAEEFRKTKKKTRKAKDFVYKLRGV